MDPDCAICSQPALVHCECEAKGLEIAIKQAETRMMSGVFSDIRTWVRQHAQDYILAYFGVLTSRRKSLHQDHIHRITDRAWHYYGAPPHPSEIAAADQELKRGIDEDWKSSVQKYPEVLEYFYGLVDLSLPSDDDPGVRDPPLSALGGGKRAPRVRGSSRGRRRRSVVEEDGREMGGGGRREGRRGGGGRPGVQFAPMPSGYGYVNPPGYP